MIETDTLSMPISLQRTGNIIFPINKERGQLTLLRDSGLFYGVTGMRRGDDQTLLVGMHKDEYFDRGFLLSLDSPYNSKVDLEFYRHDLFK